MVIDAGGNIGDSQAAKLASHFSLMMVVCLPKDKLDGLKSKLDSMKDMNVAVYEAEIEASNVTPEIACKYSCGVCRGCVAIIWL